MTILNVPITKAGNKTIPVDYDKIPTEALEFVTIEGLKPILNRRMSKITVKDLAGDKLAEAHAAALAIANENLAKLYANDIKKGRSATSSLGADGKKVSGVVMTRARNDAKAVIKNEIRNAGGKVSHYEAKEITDAANKLLAVDAEGVANGTVEYSDSFIGKAEAAIAALTAKTSSVVVADGADAAAKLEAEKARKAEAEAKLASLGGLKASPKLVEKAAEKRAKAKAKAAADGTISAKQAGMTAKAAPRKGSQPGAAV